MGIREQLNQHQGMTVGVTAGIIVLAIGLAVWYASSSGNANAGGTETTGFFTDDDGKSFFIDDGRKIPPFDRNGKPAYGCYVFTNDGGKTKYVAWLYRYTEQGRKHLEELRASKGGQIVPSPFSNIEVKLPGTGDKGWVRSTDPKALEIQRPPSSNGPMAEQVHPE